MKIKSSSAISFNVVEELFYIIYQIIKVRYNYMHKLPISYINVKLIKVKPTEKNLRRDL
jgi:hypothetical protein